MSKAKTHVNTQQEKTAIGKTLMAVPLILMTVLVIVVVVYSFFLSPKESSSEEASKILWLDVIPGSTWSYSDSSCDSSLVPRALANATSISFGTSSSLSSSGVYSFKAKAIKTESTVVGSFRLVSSSGGQLIFGTSCFEVTFSDMSNQSFDENRYLMRIYLEDGSSIDYFFAL